MPSDLIPQKLSEPPWKSQKYLYLPPWSYIVPFPLIFLSKTHSCSVLASNHLHSIRYLPHLKDFLLRLPDRLFCEKAHWPQSYSTLAIRATGKKIPGQLDSSPTTWGLSQISPRFSLPIGKFVYISRIGFPMSIFSSTYIFTNL